MDLEQLQELRDSLGVIHSSAYLLARTPVTADKRLKHLAKIDRHVARCNALLAKIWGQAPPHGTSTPAP